MKFSQLALANQLERPAHGSLRGAATRALTAIHAAGRERGVVRELLALSDAQLDDIGLDRDEVAKVARGEASLDELADRWRRRRAGRLDRWESMLSGKRRVAQAASHPERKAQLIA